MDIEQRRAILDQARATVERIAHVTVEHRDHYDDDAMAKWSRGMPKPAPTPAPQPHSPTVAEIEALRTRDWCNFVDSRAAAAIERDNAIWREVHGRVIADERKRWRSEIAKLQATVDALNLRVDALTHEETKRLDAVERGDVVELERRRHA